MTVTPYHSPRILIQTLFPKVFDFDNSPGWPSLFLGFDPRKDKLLDEIRNDFSDWLKKENLQSSLIMKVVLCFERVASPRAIGRKLKFIQTDGQEKTLSLEDAAIRNLPSEIQEKASLAKRHGHSEMDITSSFNLLFMTEIPNEEIFPSFLFGFNPQKKEIPIPPFWDEIRNDFSAWLKKENLQSSLIMKAVLCFERVAGPMAIGRKFKIIQTDGQEKTVSLEEADIQKLPSEIKSKACAANRHGHSEMDITSQVLTY